MYMSGQAHSIQIKIILWWYTIGKICFSSEVLYNATIAHKHAAYVRLVPSAAYGLQQNHQTVGKHLFSLPSYIAHHIRQSDNVSGLGRRMPAASCIISPYSTLFSIRSCVQMIISRILYFMHHQIRLCASNSHHMRLAGNRHTLHHGRPTVHTQLFSL